MILNLTPHVLNLFLEGTLLSIPSHGTLRFEEEIVPLRDQLPLVLKSYKTPALTLDYEQARVILSQNPQIFVVVSTVALQLLTPAQAQALKVQICKAATLPPDQFRFRFTAPDTGKGAIRRSRVLAVKRLATLPHLKDPV